MNELAGTGTLIRLILRRDGWKFLIWVVLTGLIPVGLAASFMELYPTAQAIQAYANESMHTPSAVGMLGLVYSQTLGGLVAWRSGLNSAILIAPVSLLFLIRHTRTEEEAGRRELLGATVVGRYAPLTAALIVVLGACLVIAILIAGGLIGMGLPAAGAIVLGLSAASTGWIFAAVAAVAAQLAESPGPARGMALGAFGVAYLLRAVGDAASLRGASGWLSWLSPLGWVRFTRAFAGEQPWVFALMLGLVVALVAAAYRLSARRDLGAGLLPARSGPAVASPRLRSPLALAWRLHRSALIAWTAGAAVIGILLGSTGATFSNFVSGPQLQGWVTRMGARDAGEAYLFIIIYVLGQVTAAYAISMALRLRSEEVDGRADTVLATGTGRTRWAASHLFFAFLGPTLLLLVLGFFIGLGFGISAGNVAQILPRLLVRTLFTLPAVWVMVGITAALFGLLPRFAAAGAWALIALYFLLEMGWELQQVSQAVFNLSPFAYVHWSHPVTIAPLIGLTLAAAAFSAAGLAAFRRRDIA